MFTHRHSQASPSITLEKGVARLRSVRPQPPLYSLREESQPGVPFHTDAERRAAAILASIAFVILLSVCLAFFLLSRSSRWEVSSLPFLFYSKLASSSSPVRPELDPFLTPLSPRRPTGQRHLLASPPRQSLEHYLSYLPHSGFHNQRIALENALVLAYILNRTLLVPPVQFGDPPIRYRSSESLRIDVALSSEIGLEHCLVGGDAIPMAEECTDFRKHTQVHWDWFVDLVPVTQQYGIRSLPRSDVTDYFLLHLGLTPADTFFVNDTSPYQFRLFDLVEDDKPVGLRYSARINIPELAFSARAYRLLQFGTLFGTSRLRLADPVHVGLRRDIRRAMVFVNPSLLAQADAVRDSAALRGYAAVHLRLGDGVFSDGNMVLRNVRYVWWRLVRDLGVKDNDAMELEAQAWNTWMPSAWGQPPSELRYEATPPVSRPSLLRLPSTCQEATHPLLQLPLYIATDTLEHPALSLFANTFPCLYFLTNFSVLLATLDPSPTAGFSSRAPDAQSHRMSENLDHLPPRLLAPFLDALIASKAGIVVGTPGSTFSKFVEDVLWRQYHGLEIVERG